MVCSSASFVLHYKFFSFLTSEIKLRRLMQELEVQAESWGVSKSALGVFRPSFAFYGVVSIQSIGFVIGSIGSLIMFIVVANISIIGKT